MFKRAVPIDKLSLPCDDVQRINADIARGMHPEDELLEARVIAHTVMCDSCRDHFNNEVLKAEKEKAESEN
jgi:hypothetical protein